MRLGKMGKPVLMNIDAFAAVASIMYILYWVLGWFVMSVVVFLRRGFGERYLSWLNLYFGYLVIGPIVWLSSLMSASTVAGVFAAKMLSILWWGFIGLSLYHRFVIWRRDRAGEGWHSLYRGHSWIRLPFIADDVMKKWVEPLSVMLLGYIMTAIDRPVSLWLMISGFALLVHEQIAFYAERQRFLDIRDAQIEAQYMQAALVGKPVEETQGFVIAAANQRMVRRDPGLRNIFLSLSPDLKELVDMPDSQEAA